MPYLLVGLVVLLVVLLLVRGATRANPQRLATLLSRALIFAAAASGIGIMLALLLRSPSLLFTLLFFLAPTFLYFWKQRQAGRALGGGWSAPGAADAPGESSVSTAFVEATLDLGTGTMRGRVRRGRYAGREFIDLSETELFAVWRECAVDQESQSVLAAYLERRIGRDWQERMRTSGSAGGGNTEDREEPFFGEEPRGPGSPYHDTDMTVAEACLVLGVPRGAEIHEIKSAHRRLMQQHHPDRGGDARRAARINRAKDILLAEAR